MGLRTRFRSLGRPVQVVLGVFLGLLFLLGAVMGTAVLGSFVLGVGDSSESTTNPPRVQFDYRTTDGGETLEITHGGGQSIDVGTLHLVVDGEPRAWEGAADGHVDVGDSTTTSASSGATVTVVWETSNAYAVLGSITLQ
ncbi:type IV pilin [Halomarina oriensis]|uniref:Type IV pilin n=1 Tax=Halomarina oriensis TaxID=671145 RepID=A0A6B0GED3_9EURY|nr:type IV pilin [Halomarina oriensis]MWG33172.1 type IV pilin [Halomarina oriensis]